MSESAIADGLKLSIPELSEKVKQKLEADKQGKPGKVSGKKSKSEQKPSEQVVKKGGEKEGGKDKKKAKKEKKDSSGKSKKPEKKGRNDQETKEDTKSDNEDESNNYDDDIMHEIEELGGTKEDLDLIKDLDDSGSESELELSDKGKEDPNLGNDLSKYMKEIGFTVSDDKLPEPKKSKDQAPAQTNNKKSETKPKKASTVKEPQVKIEDIKHPEKAIITPRNDWYNQEELQEPLTPQNHVSDEVVRQLHEKAKELLAKENDVYIHDDAKSGSQKQFLSQLLTSGTLSDKIGALILLIQSAPVHSMKHFDTLLGLCKKKARRTALQGVAALKDLFVGGVLPDRKLKWFKNQPVCPNTPKEWLILWAFEDWLKNYYFNLLQVLETLSHDTIANIRSNCVVHVIELLKSKPEQEVNLLRLGVNKLVSDV
jgi:ribosome biogenesis protein MAK21